jgi:hypothetical protein
MTNFFQSIRKWKNPSTPKLEDQFIRNPKKNPNMNPSLKINPHFRQNNLEIVFQILITISVRTTALKCRSKETIFRAHLAPKDPTISQPNQS